MATGEKGARGSVVGRGPALVARTANYAPTARATTLAARPGKLDCVNGPRNNPVTMWVQFNMRSPSRISFKHHHQLLHHEPACNTHVRIGPLLVLPYTEAR